MLARILIIEDNPQNLELMRYLLTAHGYEVFAAVDGAAAITILAQSRPDLILCDIQMPGMNGFEFLKRLKGQEQLSSIPVIAVTALAMVGDRAQILAAGFNGYLSKPIAPETFVAQVCAWLPAHQQAAPLPARTSAPEEKEEVAGRMSQRPHVLLVDNLQSNLDLAEVVLDDLGYETVQAHSMRDALQRLEEETPDLIMSDVCMSEGSGFELLQAVKNNPLRRNIPFILITSTNVNDKDRHRGLALGADRYLFRPIEPPVLRGELEACLAASRGKT